MLVPCLTGKGLRVESRCVQVGAGHAKRKLPVVSPVQADYQAALVRLSGCIRMPLTLGQCSLFMLICQSWLWNCTDMVWSYLKAWEDANRRKHVCICLEFGNIIPRQASTEDHRRRIWTLFSTTLKSQRRNILNLWIKGPIISATSYYPNFK